MDLQNDFGALESNSDNDEYKINFLNATDKLLLCQKNKNLISCMSCPQILACEVRSSYVTSAYKNMNKGQSGTFEFN